MSAWPEAHMDAPVEWLDDEQVAAELSRIQRNPRPSSPAWPGTCPEHQDADCGSSVLGAPADTDAYEPRAAQRRFVSTRDRRCRMPNCGQRVGWADLDHVVAHGDGGATSCSNLCCACRSHHRLKTFARGWRFRMEADGTLHVTSPSGITRTTRPPGLRPPETPPSPPDPADDPPPF
jgi:hypothetical protein